jgi:hypothetical protein
MSQLSPTRHYEDLYAKCEGGLGVYLALLVVRNTVQYIKKTFKYRCMTLLFDLKKLNKTTLI